MSMPRRERAKGDEELRLDGGPNGAAMDEEVGMELVKLLVGAASAQQLGDSGGEMVGGAQRRSMRRPWMVMSC
jgi:hypothetical protein